MPYTIYKVTILPFIVSRDEQAGFIDNMKVEQYGLIPGLTYEQCQNKRRANIRWGDIMESIGMTANPSISNISAINATVNSEASKFYFEISFTAAAQPAMWENGILITGADAIQNMIAHAIINDSVDQCEVFDPTMTEPISDKFHPDGIIAPHIAVGSRFIILNIGLLANTLNLAKSHILIDTVVSEPDFIVAEDRTRI